MRTGVVEPVLVVSGVAAEKRQSAGKGEEEEKPAEEKKEKQKTMGHQIYLSSKSLIFLLLFPDLFFFF